MKIISIISFLILQITVVFGQSNVFPDTFPKTPGYKSVIVKETCLTCPGDKKEKLSEKYLFNDKGQNIAWFPICDNEPCGKQLYTYDGDNLVSYTNKNTWISTSTTEDYGMAWDSTILTNKLEYLYENNKLVKTIWTDGRTDRISLEINYKYNNQGHLQSETIIDYPDSNSVGTFEPNSTELIADADLKNQVTLKKEYSHTDSTVTIKYFKNDNLTGIETKLKNKQGRIIKSILKNLSDQVLKVLTYTYNQDLLKEKDIYETGYNGFGNPYDFDYCDKEIYEYNDNGNLKEKKFFLEGQLQTIKKYEYKE